MRFAAHGGGRGGGKPRCQAEARKVDESCQPRVASATNKGNRKAEAAQYPIYILRKSGGAFA